ncbi:sensor histidine kinase [Brachybacterium sp. AOP43-C2-M15]|uniref:sensor histidine kinase n=1 Tax=Brachybacterium sp. AOP43-C2-M15 TaxID=3457661 RepID=UPI0040347068
MGIASELTQEQLRAERREDAVFTALPFLLLAVATLITLLDLPQVRFPVLALALTVVSAAWVAWWVTAHPQWRARPGLMGVHYAGLTLLAAALVALAPWYGIFAVTGYLHAYPLLPGRWKLLGAATTSMILAVTYLGGIDRIRGDQWWLWLVISLLGTVLTVFAYRLTASAEQRAEAQRRALLALEEANRRLEAANAANDVLQARLLAQAREAGTLAERQRVAREIHDTIAQGLAGILTQLQAAEPTLPDTSPAHERLAVAERLARESLVEARRTVRALGPEQLERGTLPEALDEVVRDWSADRSLPAELSARGEPRPLPAPVEAALLRVAQEALTNVAKHARASHVELSLVYAPRRIVLEMRDDGIGFDPEAVQSPRADGGYGLEGMRRRLEEFGGRLVVDASPGTGTALCATVPG